MTDTTATIESSSPRRTILRSRNLLEIGALVATSLVVAIAGTGGTFALWNDSAPVQAATISTGSIGLTINGVQNHTVGGLSMTSLLPGRSVVAAQPMTLTNTGSVPLSVTSAGVTGSSTNGLLGALQLGFKVAPAATCTVTPFGTNLPATVAPISLAVGESKPVCLEVRLNSSAPASVQGGSATFTLNLLGTQVRP